MVIGDRFARRHHIVRAGGLEQFPRTVGPFPIVAMDRYQITPFAKASCIPLRFDLGNAGANETAGRFTACHFDFPMRECTVELDGVKVVERGRLSKEML